MNFEKRLAALEKHFAPEDADPIIFEMADGSEVRVNYTPGQVQDVVSRAFQESSTDGPYSPDIDLLRRSVRGTEPGGHMLELARAVLVSPTEFAERAN